MMVSRGDRTYKLRCDFKSGYGRYVRLLPGPAAGPRAVFKDPGRKNGYLVITEVLNADSTPHESNGRATVEAGWKGWLEDRRPASNADPYKVAGRIVKTVKAASANIKI